MSSEIGWLCLGAFGTGMLHTAIGPDHYVPFVAMSRVGGWSMPKTLLVTTLCGIGHVASSVLLGLAGMMFGSLLFRGDASPDKLAAIEADRGDLAGWLLVAFGLMYLTWGVWRAIRNQPHSHPHVHPDGTVHSHEHVHQGDHLHVHATEPAPPAAINLEGRAGEGGRSSQPSPVSAAAAPTKPRGRLTPWVLFTIFLFGPCEPLIPLMMVPTIQGHPWGVAVVTLLFSLATILTMLTAVSLLCLGVGVFQNWGARFERFGHALAGAAVLACGLAIKVGL
ncbi:MAG: hypothetical protein AB7O62_23970 [Pirellulales bacterium]